MMGAPRPRVAFRIFGCRLNQAEAAEWQAALRARAIPLVPPDTADILCVHSCAVTATAAQEVAKTLRTYRTHHPDARIILSGCAATLAECAPLADLVIPHADKAAWGARLFDQLSAWGYSADPPPTPVSTRATTRARASLILQDGCDRFCTYCIVPYLRGTPTSTPLAEVLRKAADCFAQGFHEIVLTGCHLALYRDPASGADLLELLRRLIEQTPGDCRLRLGSLEPGVVDDRALIRLIADSDGRICPFFHLPLQSAADPVLRRMGRPNTHAGLRALLDTLCETFDGTTHPLCGLGADWIVGFPGETEADAEVTRRLVADYPFTGGHIFPYSPRPNTPAATYPDQIPPQTLHARVTALTQTFNATRARTLPRFLNQPLTVVPERLRDGLWEGWSAQRIRCQFPAPTPELPLRGTLQTIIPQHLTGDRLTGHLVR